MGRLIDVLPDLADELKNVLFDLGEYELAKSVDKLPVVERCRCGNAECATFYTVEKEKWQDRPVKHMVPGRDDIVELDICDDTIVRVEILDREELAVTLRELLP